jgi:3-deoxy-D-arabino-heptulosonate 7-phosphate (DAHP) synthase class II
VQLEKDKLREEQNKTIEGRKERVNQKKCVLEQMDSFYGGLIGEVKQQIRKERNERKLVESTHRAALMNLVKEISSSKVGELESCVDILVDEIKKSDEENEDQILTQEFMNMYKNI